MGELGVAAVIILVLVVALLVMHRLLVAVGGSAWHSGPCLMRHGSYRIFGHGIGSPAEEYSEHHCCQEANEAHACRWIHACGAKPEPPHHIVPANAMASVHSQRFVGGHISAVNLEVMSVAIAGK